MENFVILSNEVRMPKVGYGVYQVSKEECERCVLDALATGYRSIDTAQAYQNESEVGSAMEKSGVPRSDIFLTTKIWISNAGQEQAKASIEESLRRLKTEYIDLMLIHQPFGDYYGTYRAMEEAYKEGTLRAIGVANFYPDRLIDLCQFAAIPPMVNQVETHVFWQQKEAHAVMEKYHVVHESWGPFAEGRNDFFKNPTLNEIGRKHGKSAAQVALRFLLQKDVVIIPKSVHKNRMTENIDILGFALDEEDMGNIEALDTGASLFFSHYDPKTVEFLTGLGKNKV